MKTSKLNIPAQKQDLLALNAGDRVLLSGIIFTARDAAHKRLTELLSANKPLPIDINNAAIYYTGPAPARAGEIIGVCGPTSSTRMDSYTPQLIDNGLAVMIGKGNRSARVIESMKGRAVYLVAVGGAAVYYQQFITACEIAAYDDLGTEAIRRLTVKDLPLLVGIDSKGGTILWSSND